MKEFEERLIRAQKIMQNHEFDGILITSPQNIRYFTGYDSQFWESPTRPWFVLIPTSGKPVAIIPSIGVPLMRGCYIDDL